LCYTCPTGDHDILEDLTLWDYIKKTGIRSPVDFQRDSNAAEQRQGMIDGKDMMASYLER
jgi:hypothetical protein